MFKKTCDNCELNELCCDEMSLHEEDRRAMTFCSDWQGWIPASEAPSESGQYLVCTELNTKPKWIAQRVISFGQYDYGEQFGWNGYSSEYGEYAINDVIAWRPLPKPYKE